MVPLRLFALCGALLFCGLFATSAAGAATTRFAVPGGDLMATNDCTVATAPCSLSRALAAAAAGDTISLAAGSYDLAAVALPDLPLAWQATDAGPGQAPRPDVRGRRADDRRDAGPVRVVVRRARDRQHERATPAAAFAAVKVEPAAAVTISASAVNGRSCVDAPDAAGVTIERSTLSTSGSGTCADLPAQSTLRSSSVDRSLMLLPEDPPPVVVTTRARRGQRHPGRAEPRRARTPSRAACAPSAAPGSRARGWSSTRSPAASPTTREASSPIGAARRDVAGRRLDGDRDERSRPVRRQLLRTARTAPSSRTTWSRPTRSPAAGSPTSWRRCSLACSLDSDCDDGLIHIDHSDFAMRVPAAGPVRRGVSTHHRGRREHRRRPAVRRRRSTSTTTCSPARPRSTPARRSTRRCRPTSTAPPGCRATRRTSAPTRRPLPRRRWPTHRLPATPASSRSARAAARPAPPKGDGVPPLHPFVSALKFSPARFRVAAAAPRSASP